MKALFTIITILLLSTSFSYGQFQNNGNIRYHFGPVGIGTSNPGSGVQLSFGNSVNSKKLALYESGSSFYGFGIDPSTLRLQIPGNSTNRFSFYAGTTEVLRLRSSGSASFIGNDPDMSILMSNASPNNLVQFYLGVDGSSTNRIEFRYDRNADLLRLFHGTTEVLEVDRNAGDYWLTVQRGIRTGGISVEAALADYVFEEDYEVPTLEEVETFIEKNHHLPGVISQAEVDAQGGVDLGDLTIQLQEKLEELYLNVIKLDKRVKELEQENAELKTQK